jgi:ferrous iron transport protein A
MTLCDLKPGQVAIVESVEIGHHGEGLVNRLEAMGIIPGKPIRVLREAWFGGPLNVRVGCTTEIAIRRREAGLVIVSQAS